MTCKFALALPAAAILLCLVGAAQPDMPRYDTPYYVIYSDLNIDAVRETTIRVTAMAEEYHQRMAGFGGVIRKKLPFYLFSQPEDYYKAGGMIGSSGVFNGQRLMAIATPGRGGSTWHVVQHEGFHQFVQAVIGGNMPIWINEGLAEYFGEAIFTGDGFVTGLVPPDRLARLQKAIRDDKTLPLRDIMLMSMRDWNGKLDIANYDQAWSMLHFLVHGENGRYQEALNGLINDISRHVRYEQAWKNNFGGNIESFQTKWKEYWANQPADPTAELRSKAVFAVVNSYFARATAQKQSFQTPQEFFAAAKDERLKLHQDDYLPPSLLKDNLPKAPKLGQWAIQAQDGKNPCLSCTLPSGKVLLGSYTIRNGQAEKVTADFASDPASQPDTKSAPSQSSAKPPASQPTSKPTATRPSL